MAPPLLGVPPLPVLPLSLLAAHPVAMIPAHIANLAIFKTMSFSPLIKALTGGETYTGKGSIVISYLYQP
jgi:hypothetical protein